MSLTPQRSAHGRSPSGRVALTRRMTRGPLDADDANADDALDPLHALDPVDPLNPLNPLSPLQDPPATTTPARVISPTHPLSLDLSFLQDPAAYHVLPVTAPPAFQHAANAPSAAAPIDSLLVAGHFRLAAMAAARNMLSAAPTDFPSLFHLMHVRLACLCLISEHALAAQEAKLLGDLSSAFYRHPLTNTHLVPWDLRVLVVRLAALGYGDWRKGIMGYYELARECRESILAAATDADKALWRHRLADTGIRVANMLVEMGDLDGAGRHLATLTDPADARNLQLMQVLVYLRVGDLATARRCLASASTDDSDDLLDATLSALVSLADADYPAATSAFSLLHARFPSNAMVAQNLAVCLLYTGRIAEARALLEGLVEETPPFYSLLFNLSTVFELCTERNREMKGRVAEVLARRRDGGGVGWERRGDEFKL